MTKSYKNLVYREEGISNSGNSAVGKVFFFKLSAGEKYKVFTGDLLCLELLQNIPAKSFFLILNGG